MSQPIYHELPIGDFTLYVTDSNGITGDIDPFHIHLQLTGLNEESGFPEFGKAICNNIPCQMCPLDPKCKSGKHLTRTVIDHVTENLPEYYI